MEPIGADATAYIALGANLGDRLGSLRAAVQGLDRPPLLRVLRTSPVYETRAKTLPSSPAQPDYLNAVVALHAGSTPEQLLATCLHIEQELGRVRAPRARWAPRVIDLDLLLFGQQVRRTPTLTLPHPRLAERRFVLQPLADLAPNLFVPAPFDATVAALLARCPDPDRPRLTPYTLEETRD